MSLTSAAVALSFMAPANANAAGFKKELKKRKLSPEDYKEVNVDGLKYIDLEEGKGDVVTEGDKVVVHFDVLFRGIDVASSRSARLLGANRTIAEPYEFLVGRPVSEMGMAMSNTESSGGLFSGSPGPKPPVALSKACVGMKRGGKRIILVDNTELGYRGKRMVEMPPDATFELQVELLNVIKK